MKRNFLLLILIISTISCNTREKPFNEIAGEVENIANSANINLTAKAIRDTGDSIYLGIAFETPYLIDSEGQILALKYFFYKSELMKKYPRVIIKYFLDIEEKSNSRIIIFDTKAAIDEIKFLFRDESIYKKLLLFCYEEMNESDIAALNFVLDIVKNGREQTGKESFFRYLEELSEKLNKGSKFGDSKVNLFYLMHLYLSSSGDKENEVLALKLAKLWLLGTGEIFNQKMKLGRE